MSNKASTLDQLDRHSPHKRRRKSLETNSTEVAAFPPLPSKTALFQVRNDTDSSTLLVVNVNSSSIKHEASTINKKNTDGEDEDGQGDSKTKVVVATEKEKIESTPTTTITSTPLFGYQMVQSPRSSNTNANLDTLATATNNINEENVQAIEERAVGLLAIVDFVDRIHDRHKKIKSSPKGAHYGLHEIHPVASDDMYGIAKRLFELQSVFAAQGKPCEVTLAYHYTKDRFVEGISQHGLNVGQRGTFGPGIYCGNNACAFHKFGPIGFIVAILKGTCKSFSSDFRIGAKPDETYNTVIGNKKHISVIGNKKYYDRRLIQRESDMDFYDEIVLQESSQCVPLIQFNSSLVTIYNSEYSGHDIVLTYHREIERAIDECFNSDISKSQKITKYDLFPALGLTDTTLQSFPMLHTIGPSTLPQMPLQNQPQQVLSSKNPVPSMQLNPARGFANNRSSLPMLQNDVYTEIISYTAPISFKDLLSSQNKIVPITTLDANYSTCAVCLSDMKLDEKLGMINVPNCQHKFHYDCIMRCAQYSKPCCPICRKLITNEPHGHSPSGTMTMSKSSSIICSGFEGKSNGTIIVKYMIERGLQKEYHSNPGVPFAPINRTAYLPHNEEGSKLLKRLKYAFQRGLIFTIGTSITTGRCNCVTWSSIHHKTRAHGGSATHGYPDDTYFANCHGELDALGVPKSIVEGIIVGREVTIN